MAGPLDKVSPAALDLARRSGLDPLKAFGPQTYYPGIDGLAYFDPSKAIEANQRVESDYTRGASGGCNQDPSRLSGK